MFRFFIIFQIFKKDKRCLYFDHDCCIEPILCTSSPSSIMILRSLLIFSSMLLSSTKDPNASSVNSAFRHWETFCPGSHIPYNTIKANQMSLYTSIYNRTKRQTLYHLSYCEMIRFFFKTNQIHDPISSSRHIKFLSLSGP